MTNQSTTIMSRYGEPRLIENLGSGIYRVTGDSSFHRLGSKEDGKSGLAYIDMQGGPMWMVGDLWDNREITSLEWRDDGSIILYTKELQ